jgi:sugar phosphate isomerase/epimerase
MRRRTFLGLAAMPIAAAPAGIRLGIDAYSLRAWKWTATQLLDYAASLKLDTLQFSNLHEFESLDAAYLSKLKARAAAANITLEVGLGSICETSAGFNRRYGTGAEYLATAIETARHLGAQVIKTYLGSSADRDGKVPLERHVAETLRTLAAARARAMDAGVKIGLENHSGDLLARELRELIEAAGREWVGACYDSGNPMMTLEDPLLALEILGPYAVTTHIRDVILFEHPRGAAWQWVAVGDGMIDWPRFMELYRKLCPGAALLIENITGRPPRVMPYFEPQFWEPFENVRGSDFATYVALARRGRPLMSAMIVADVPGEQPPEYREALRQQQKRDLEKGLQFCKTTLGAGVNCRA